MRNINPEKVAKWFDPWKMKALFMFEGYDNYSAPLAKILGVNEKTVRDKVSQSRFSHEETLDIAEAEGWTMEEYCQIFARNLYGDKKESASE